MIVLPVLGKMKFRIFLGCNDCTLISAVLESPRTAPGKTFKRKRQMTMDLSQVHLTDRF